MTTGNIANIYSNICLPDRSISFLQLPYQTTGSKQILSFTELSSNKWLLIPSFSSLLTVPNLGCFSLSLNSHSKELLCPISSVTPPLWSQLLYQILSTFHTLSNIIFMCAFLSFHLTCKFLKRREHEFGLLCNLYNTLLVLCVNAQQIVNDKNVCSYNVF